MSQPFAESSVKAEPTAPSPKWFAITPNDDTDLTDHIRAITINAAGVIVAVNWDGETCTSATLPAGTYVCLATRIKATGTTATGITGWV